MFNELIAKSNEAYRTMEKDFSMGISAFCNEIDCEGDIRILCNLQEDMYWMETNLHEFGHAPYLME